MGLKSIHPKYNLSFVEIDRLRTCRLADNTSPAYVNLCYYLIQLQYADNVESILHEVEEVMNGKPQDDVYFAVGHEDLEMNQSTTTIIDNGTIEILPTPDFKVILEEYLDFLRDRPMLDTFALWLSKLALLIPMFRKMKS